MEAGQGTVHGGRRPIRATRSGRATELLRWTDETFGPDGYVVASNMQDAVLIDLAAKVRPGVQVLFLDTGYHFPETIGTRDAVETMYDIRLLNVTPEHTVAEQDALPGKDLFARDPDECCRLRKVIPLTDALHGCSAWVTGLRRVDAPTRAGAPLIGFDEKFGLVKVNPLAAWVRTGHGRLHRRAQCAGEPARRRGIPLHRLRPVHRKTGSGRRSAQWALAGTREGRMRFARFVSR